MMTTASDSLLLKFRPTDSVIGVTRKTVYPADDGPLTARQFAAVKADAAKHLPKGKVLTEASLF